MTRLQRLVRPLFCDVTWGAGGSTSDLSLDLALHLQQESQNINTNSNKSYSCGMANLHMTCTNMMNSEHPADDLRKVVQLAMAGGIANIVALRGDPPAGGAGGETTTTNSEFECALDLVRFLRQEFDAAALGLSVAGYPEGHPVAITPVDTETDPLTDRELARSSTDLTTGQVYTCREAAYEAELAYLKQKVDAGAGTFTSFVSPTKPN